MIDTIFGFISSVYNRFRGQKRRSDDELNQEVEAPRKRLRMEHNINSGSSYFPDVYHVRNSESQTNDDLIVCDDLFETSPTISLLDDSSEDEKENLSLKKKAVKKVSPFKHKYRPPKHCAPVKFNERRSAPPPVQVDSDENDVEFVGYESKKTFLNLTDFNNSKKPLIKRRSAGMPYSTRGEFMLQSVFKRPIPPFTKHFDVPGRREYGLLLGSVLKSPELFKPTEKAKQKLTTETIDLTKEDINITQPISRTYSRLSRSNLKSLSDRFEAKRSSDFIDLTKVSSTQIKSKVEEVPRPPVKVAPVNTFARKLRHEPCTSTNYVSQLLDNIKALKLEFVKSEEEILKHISIHAPLQKSWQKALDERVKRHVKITESIIDIEVEEEEEELPLPELTEKMLDAVENAWDSRKSLNQVLVNNFNYQIRRSDLSTLHKLNWLNDEVINFYMQLITERGKIEGFPSVYTFNTFFFPKLAKDGHASLRRWTRKVDIFSYDIIIVPIHLQIHWCLASINFKEKTIKYYDSMGHSNQKCLNLLLQYLKDEMADKKQEKFDDSDWKCQSMKDIPQQMNSCDCGVFACTFAEYISRRARFTFGQKDMPYFRKKMTYEILTSKLLKW